MHLLACHVQLHVQSHDLLLHEPEVILNMMMVVILANDAHPNNMRQNMYMRTNSTPYYIPFCILECPLLIK